MSLLQGNPNIQAAVTGSGIFVGLDATTITWRDEFVAGNSWGITLEGTVISVSFATTSDAMVDSIVAAIAAVSGFVQQVKVATYDGSPRIVVYGKLQGHQLAWASATGTVGGFIEQDGIKEVGLLVTDPFALLAAINTDSNTAGTVYTGYALAGSTATDPVWAVKRVVTAVNVAVTTWSGGTTKNAYKWSDRAALTYS